MSDASFIPRATFTFFSSHIDFDHRFAIAEVADFKAVFSTGKFVRSLKRR